jgi:hypothetical protein
MLLTVLVWLVLSCTGYRRSNSRGCNNEVRRCLRKSVRCVEFLYDGAKDAHFGVHTAADAILYLCLDPSRTTCKLVSTVEGFFHLAVVSHEIREFGPENAPNPLD